MSNHPLFDRPDTDKFKPLADRMRPNTLDKFVGQDHLLGKGKPLLLAINGRHLHSMIFWGPPGTGKTTLARMFAGEFDAAFLSISAVLSGVKEIRAAIDKAYQYKAEGRPTILFVDEVHRFNKSQQDAFLPQVEDGTIIFIGATTENPSFELNNALLSRARVYVLKPLSVGEISSLIQNALLDMEKGVSSLKLNQKNIEKIANAADGDARRALNFLELIADLAQETENIEEVIQDVITGGNRRFDKNGENFYDQISAMHKSMRGSDPDATLYWFCRMLDGGIDPLYLARRMLRMASEDIGNADPRALQIAMDAWQTFERLGSPEGELTLAQCAIYLAVAPKSNAVYKAYNKVRQDIKNTSSLEVPMHIRNAPTKLMQDLGYGKDYRYAHNEKDNFAAGEIYLPEELKDVKYYEPLEQGLEIKIKSRLAKLAQMNTEYKTKGEKNEN